MTIHPPESWRDPSSHMLSLVEHPWYQRAWRLLDCTIFAAHSYFRNQGAISAPVPITTGAVSSPMGRGSDSLPVQALINGKPIYLPDSMQFALELASRIETRPVYYIMPSFRGEDLDDRHLNQFIHAEVEIPGNLESAMKWATGLVVSLSRSLLEDRIDDLVALGGDPQNLERVIARGGAFSSIRFSDACGILSDDQRCIESFGHEHAKLTPYGERELIRRLGDFVWVTHMPRSTVPFYQAVEEKNPLQTKTADLLAGIGEILGSGQRALRGSEVVENLTFCGVSPNDYRWYIEMKERWPLQTSGFGLGIERFLMWATKTSDIRNWCMLLRDAGGHGEP